jgi:hypothetical protein
MQRLPQPRHRISSLSRRLRRPHLLIRHQRSPLLP